jgi:hypothetical protein
VKANMARAAEFRTKYLEMGKKSRKNTDTSK